MFPPTNTWLADQAAAQDPDAGGDGVPVGVGVGGGAPPPQGPLSCQTPTLPPGVSPWVHHFAVQLWPLKEAVLPPTKTWVALHGGAQLPGGAGVGEGGGVPGVPPANLTVNAVKSPAFCGTLLHSADV